MYVNVVGSRGQEFADYAKELSQVLMNITCTFKTSIETTCYLTQLLKLHPMLMNLCHLQRMNLIQPKALYKMYPFYIRYIFNSFIM